MTAIAYLQHSSINSGTRVKVYCKSVDITGDKNIDTTPNANINTLTEVGIRSIQNPVYTLTDVRITTDANTLSYVNLLTLYKATYNGTSADQLKLIVTYGTSSTLPSCSVTTSTSIPVVIDSFNIKFDASEVKDARIAQGSITLVETL